MSSIHRNHRTRCGGAKPAAVAWRYAAGWRATRAAAILTALLSACSRSRYRGQIERGKITASATAIARSKHRLQRDHWRTHAGGAARIPRQRTGDRRLFARCQVRRAHRGAHPAAVGDGVHLAPELGRDGSPDRIGRRVRDSSLWRARAQPHPLARAGHGAPTIAAARAGPRCAGRCDRRACAGLSQGAERISPGGRRCGTTAEEPAGQHVVRDSRRRSWQAERGARSAHAADRGL